VRRQKKKQLAEALERAFFFQLVENAIVNQILARPVDLL
jgi:hypothetical protein